MTRSLTRRRFLHSALGAPLLASAACSLGRGGDTAGSVVTITLAGQALMTHPLCADPYAGLDEVIDELRRGDVAFTDLEAAIDTPQSGRPTRDTGFLHIAPPSVLTCLRQMGFDLLALANNHAWDLDTAGVLATREAVAGAGFGFAGTGPDLAAASAAGLSPGRPHVALVSMATGKIREGAAATMTRAGINELRMDNGELVEEDVARNLAAIASARRRSSHVIACLHNHQWGEDMTTTKPWARRFAKRCIDAGADLFASHGAPLLHGIEIYRGKALLHGLGSLVFQSRTETGYYPREVWESVIAHCRFEDSRLAELRLVPVVLNEQADDPLRRVGTRGRPRIAGPLDGQRILGSLAALSAELGTAVRSDGNLGRVQLR